MEDIINLWDELYKKGTKYFEPEIKLRIYDSLLAFMGDYMELEKNQIKLTNIKIRENFRYIKNEYKSLLEYKKIVDTLKYQYYKSYENLIDKKKKYFQSYDIEYWGLSKEDMKNKEYLIKDLKLAMTKMFPEETKKVDDYKKMYGCYLNSFIQEFEIKRENNDIIDNLLNYLKEIKDNFTNSQIKYNDLIAHISLANNHDHIKEDKIITIENKSKNEALEKINK